MTDRVSGNRGRRWLRPAVRNRRQVLRNGGPASVRRLAVSPIPLCLFEFQFFLVWLLVLIWTPGLTVEVQAQNLTCDRAAPVALYNATDGANRASNENWLSDEPLMKKKVSAVVVTDKSKAQWTIKTTSSSNEDSTAWSKGQ